MSPHVISSHGHNPEVNTRLPKLMSVLPVILPYPPGWALPQQESGVASRLPACDPHMPRSMRHNINLLGDFSEQMRQSMGMLFMSLLLLSFFWKQPFGKDGVKQKSKNCLCIFTQAIIKMGSSFAIPRIGVIKHRTEKDFGTFLSVLEPKLFCG